MSAISLGGLTQAGRKRLARAVPVWQRHHAQLESLLAAPDALRAALGRLSALD